MVEYVSSQRIFYIKVLDANLILDVECTNVLQQKVQLPIIDFKC